MFSCPAPTAHSTRLPFQVVVEGPSSSTELHNLTSSTEYLVSVFPVYEAGAAEGLRGLVTTGGWGKVGRAQGGDCCHLQTPLEPGTKKGGAAGSYGSYPGVWGPSPTCCVTEADSLDLSDPQCSLLNKSVVIRVITTARTHY